MCVCVCVCVCECVCVCVYTVLGVRSDGNISLCSCSANFSKFLHTLINGTVDILPEI